MYIYLSIYSSEFFQSMYFDINKITNLTDKFCIWEKTYPDMLYMYQCSAQDI